MLHSLIVIVMNNVQGISLGATHLVNSPGRGLLPCVQPDWTMGGQAQKTKTGTPVRLHGQYYYKMIMNDWLSVSSNKKN